MKSLLLIRHAKSNWPENTEDYNRPLATRGVQDAHKMAAFLLAEHIHIDQMITSSALRAKSTCTIFADIYQMNFAETRELYHAGEKQFLDVITKADDAVNSLAIYSHNNGISEFASSLCKDDTQFKTCAVARYQIDTETWAEFKDAPKELKDYFTPKNLV